MTHWADMTDEEGFRRLEHKTEEIRKLLFGAVLLAKDLWQEELSRGPEGLGIMAAMEASEESFADRSQPDQGKRLEQTIDVIRQRAGSIFDVMSYVSKCGRHEGG